MNIIHLGGAQVNFPHFVMPDLIRHPFQRRRSGPRIKSGVTTGKTAALSVDAGLKIAVDQPAIDRDRVADDIVRSEESRDGKEWVSKYRFRWSRYHYKTKLNIHHTTNSIIPQQ